MGKILISEKQYNRIKKVLIENAINKSLLNEQSGELSYTVQSNQVSFENADNSNYPELKIFKGAKFTPIFQKNTFMDKLVANTKFQFIVSFSTGLSVSGAYAGEVVPSFDSDDADETWDSSNKFYTYTNKVYFNCNNSRFSVPSNSPDKYFAEDSPAPELAKELSKLCQKAKTQKSSYGAESVGGGKSYTQQNDYVVKADNGATLKIPKGTGYAFKEGKNGAAFKVRSNKFGWFGCQSKIFLVDKVKYKDAKGYLANNIVKSICPTTPVTNNSKDTSFKGNTSGQSTVVGGGGAGSGGGSGTGSGGGSQDMMADFANYI